MKKLTKEDIQFIDRYLSNSGIHYEDVKIELIDHVASAIECRMNNGDERTFYYVFKEYMIENKALLEKQGKPYQWKTLKSVLKMFISNLFSIKSLIGGLLLFIGLWFFNNFLYEKYTFTALSISWTLFIISIIPFVKLRKKKYSFIGNLLLFDALLYYLGFCFLDTVEYNSTAFYIALCMLSLFCATSFKTMSYLITFYKKRFQLI